MKNLLLRFLIRLLKIPRFGCWLAEVIAFFKTLACLNFKQVENTVLHFRPELKDDRKKLKQLRNKVIRDGLRHKMLWKEYFLFRFDHISEKEKREYIGDIERGLLIKRVCTFESKRLFENKYKCYETFKPYYRREIIMVKSRDDFPAFEAFFNRHDRFMVKNLRGAFGKGNYISDNSGDIGETFNKCLSVAPCVVEELIKGNEKLEAFHPQSINTIRISTFIKDDIVHPLFSTIRFGVGDHVVDNAGSGGVYAAIDIKTGKIISNGVDKSGNEFESHPDSNMKFKGYQIPRWKELLETLEIVARIVPDQQYVGWDFTLNDKEEWVMVEGNAGGQFGYQYAVHRGLRSVLAEFMMW